MKRMIFILLLLVFPAQVFADDGFYGSFSGMISIMEDSDLRYNDDEAGEMELDTGVGFSVALGKKFGNGFRGEIEYAQRRSGISLPEQILLDDFGALDVSWIDANVHTYTAMFNLVYDIENDSGMTPYFGGGLGIGWLEIPLFESGAAFAYQVLAGVNCEMTERTDLILGYRYAGMSDPETSIGENSMTASVDSHNLEIGVRYSF